MSGRKGGGGGFLADALACLKKIVMHRQAALGGVGKGQEWWFRFMYDDLWSLADGRREGKKRTWVVVVVNAPICFLFFSVE